MEDRPAADRPNGPVVDKGERARGVLKRLREASTEGFVPFDRYMEVALYDPAEGYYGAQTPGFGRCGDFYTAPHLHPLFGATIAAHLLEVWRELGRPPGFRIVEVGAGDGTLAADILLALSGQHPEGPVGEYVLVERSMRLLRTADEKLRAVGRTSGYRWRTSRSVAEEGPIRGIVLANELLDAFPFRRFERGPDGWVELGVEIPRDGPLVWARRPVERQLPPPGLPGAAPLGTVLEVSPLAEAWLREVADHLVAGRAIFLDYGGEEPDLLQKGPSGTLSAVRAHRPTPPLAGPGTHDLSAFVNFTRIRDAARRAGLVEVAFTRQADRLNAWGLSRRLDETTRRSSSVDAVKAQLAVKSLLFSFDTFWVLELAPPRDPVVMP